MTIPFGIFVDTYKSQNQFEIFAGAHMAGKTRKRKHVKTTITGESVFPVSIPNNKGKPMHPVFNPNNEGEKIFPVSITDSERGGSP